VQLPGYEPPRRILHYIGISRQVSARSLASLAKWRRSLLIPLRTLSLQARCPVEHDSERLTGFDRVQQDEPLAVAGHGVLV
jgi:hypothetical protein